MLLRGIHPLLWGILQFAFRDLLVLFVNHRNKFRFRIDRLFRRKFFDVDRFHDRGADDDRVRTFAGFPCRAGTFDVDWENDGVQIRCEAESPALERFNGSILATRSFREDKGSHCFLQRFEADRKSVV